MTQLELLDKGRVASRSREEWLVAIAEKQGYDIRFANGCCESEYPDKPIAMANWNSRTKWDDNLKRHVTLDDTMPRLAKLFEKLGYEIEWEDEWETCETCGKAFRTSPNSYSWKPYYWAEDGCIVCGDCVLSDPEEYLGWLSGNAKHCEVFGIDLSKYGYERHSGEYESGFHPGQNDNPKTISTQLRKDGITDFIFVLDGTGQFDCEFSVWIKQQ